MIRKILLSAAPVVALAAAGLLFSQGSAQAVPVDEVAKVQAVAAPPQEFHRPGGSYRYTPPRYPGRHVGRYPGGPRHYRDFRDWRSWNDHRGWNDYRGRRDFRDFRSYSR